MSNKYEGYVWRTIKCNNLEEMEYLMESGEVFRTDKMNFYYRCIPNKGRKDTPKNVCCLRSVCVTSVTTKGNMFYKFDVDSAAKLYYGKELEKLILSEVKKFVLNMNPKTMRAFGGLSFQAYLRAIPDEIFAKKEFYSQLENTIKSSFIDKANSCKMDSDQDLENLVSCIGATSKTLETAKSLKKEKQKILQEKTLQAKQEEIKRRETALSKIDKFFK